MQCVKSRMQKNSSEQMIFFKQILRGEKKRGNCYGFKDKKYIDEI